MQYYFVLQYRRFNRYLLEFGIRPILGSVMMVLGFIGFSSLLFEKVEYAEYIYFVLGGMSIGQSSEQKRLDFLKQCFVKRDYYQIRLLENSFLGLPFLLFLGYQYQWLLALGILLLILGLVFIRFNYTFNTTIPTPFSQRPFEFTIGFRKSLLMIGLVYFLTIMAIVVRNFDLGIVALFLTFLTSMTFYSKPEQKYFVWIYHLGAKPFLLNKFKIGLLHLTIICLPILVGMAIYFPNRIWILVAFQLLVYFYLITIILAKYSAFPREMSLPQVIVLSFGIFFPPLLLVIIPFLYRQSIKQLNQVLA